MSSESSPSRGGIGFLSLLAIVFITLKLCGVIEWSWWWVTAPLWAPFAIVAAVVVICLFGVGACQVGIRLIDRKEDGK